MILLPVVDRELRVASRRRSTYRNRFWSAFFALSVMGLMLLSMSRYTTTSQQAQTIFLTLTSLFFFSSLLAGITITADCVSEEKRGGTLGLLFLTDLKGYDVIVGKFVSSSLNAFYGLLSTVPILAVPLLLGSITSQQVWHTALLLLNTLFFSLSAGIFVSTMAQNERKAMSGTFSLIMFFTALIPLSGVLLYNYYLKINTVPPVEFFLPSPGYGFFLEMESWGRGAMTDPNFTKSLVIIHAISWSFLIGASVFLPRSWQDKAATARVMRWRDRLKQWSFGDAAERKRFRARLLKVNPFYWLAGRDRLKPMWVWAVLGLSAAGWLWGYFKLKGEWLFDGNYIMTAALLHFCLKVWIAVESCQRIGQDHQSGSLELILTTPLTVKEILRGQMLALQRQFLRPMILILVADFFFMVANSREEFWVFWWGWWMVTTVFDCYALAWLAMWTGLTSPRLNRAAMDAVGRVLALPAVAFVLTMAFFAITGSRLPAGGKEEYFFMGLWFFYGLLNSVYWLATARGRMHSQFRFIAARRFNRTASTGWWFGRRKKKSATPGTPAASPA